MLEEYYNAKTKTLTIRFSFNEELNDLPVDTQIMIFKEDSYNVIYSEFNQLVDNLPKNLTNLTFGWKFNQSVDKLPESVTHLTF